MIISLISLIVIIAYFILDEYLLLTVIFGASWIFAPKAFLDLATTLFMKFAYSRSLAREIPTKDALVALCKTLMTMYSSYTYKVTSLLDVGVLAICITLNVTGLLDTLPCLYLADTCLPT